MNALIPVDVLVVVIVVIEVAVVVDVEGWLLISPGGRKNELLRPR